MHVMYIYRLAIDCNIHTYAWYIEHLNVIYYNIYTVDGILMLFWYRLHVLYIVWILETMKFDTLYVQTQLLITNLYSTYYIHIKLICINITRAQFRCVILHFSLKAFRHTSIL